MYFILLKLHRARYRTYICVGLKLLYTPVLCLVFNYFAKNFKKKLAIDLISEK